jgi:H+/Cl- antiporter ClcA
MAEQAQSAPKSSWLTLAWVTVMVGLLAGLGGMALGMLLRLIQHAAYGYSLDTISGSVSFLQGATAASPLRRVVALTICGVVAGIGWWAVYRWGKPLVSVSKAIDTKKPLRMPFITTLAHDLLQIVTVAMGSPLGRETAPRELGAVLATWVSDRAGLTADQTRTMIACGAGAGLAAVYNVPLGGALFTLEVLLVSFRPAALLPALSTSAIATLVSWIGLGNEAQYTIPSLTIGSSLMVWSMVVGPLFGVAAYWFVLVTNAAQARAPRDRRLLWWCLGVFVAIGLLAIRFPELLGNGKSVARLGFDSHLGLVLAGALLILRVVITVGSVRAGAAGGLLTPSIAIGALLATVLGQVWNLVWPETALGAFAIVGAAAFLASSLRMPLTSIVLMMEFTRVGHDFLLPMLFSTAGSIATYYLCASQTEKATKRLLDVQAPDLSVPSDRGASYEEASTEAR